MPIKLLCFVSNANFSGATKLTLDIINLLDKNHFDIRVIFLKYDRKASHIFKKLRESDIKFTILRKVLPNWLTRFKLGEWVSRLFLGIFGEIFVFFKLKNIFYRFLPDVVYSNSVLLPVSSLKKYIKNPKIYYHIHLQPMLIMDNKKLTETHIEKLNSADKVIVISSNQEKLLIERGVKRELLYLFSQSILPFTYESSIREKIRSLLNYEEDDVVVCGGGVISARKGFDIFVKTALKIPSSHDNKKIRFLWVGGGSYKDFETPDSGMNVIESIQKLGNHLHITGMVPNPYDYFSAVDIFVMCSRSEGIPLVMLENMYLEKAVVAFDNSGIREVISDCGILVKDEDVDDMARKILELASNQGKRSILGASAKKCIQEKHDLSKNTERLSKLFLESVTA